MPRAGDILPAGNFCGAAMDTNHLPVTDFDRLEAGFCCPELDPAAWDGLDLHFRGKPFVRARTRSFFHIPVNMGSVFARTWSAIKRAQADEGEFVILSDDHSMWCGEHYFSVKNPVPGLDNTTLTGDYVTHVFEGPYRDAPKWVEEMKQIVAKSGRTMGRLFLYYTTCPACAKKRGKNYVVGIAELSPT